MALNFFDKVSQNFIELLNDKDDYNVIIKVKIRKNLLWHIRTYIYGGIVNLENVETRFIFDLMLVTNEFKLEELTNKLEILLIDTKASWLKTHFSLVYQSTLVSLLKRDDLQMKEVEIWDYAIKWGISQNSTLPTNLEEWSKENCFTLKTTLQQCLPFIRYFHLLTYEVLDINQHLLAPERPVKSIILPSRSVLADLPPRTNKSEEFFSTIVSKDHVAEISIWIDQMACITKILGYLPWSRWYSCGAKVEGTDEIVGGYNPLAWDNSNISLKWMATNDSFIFSLKNGNIKNSILSREKFPINQSITWPKVNKIVMVHI
ncbi:hypothetical protein Glove_176g19 [Diversispora epigaea]|uniref:BACK domain-containing protein n=1 Tax=Diversispora epigaea TaxID=1348612 RepID=A0A397IY11_9GLOM|nr:hypothetical protein Glove_176g19 [Diversispora epigaea]